MSIFLISDNHFDAFLYMHDVFPRTELCDPKNSTVENNEKINNEMITRWNSVVSDNDLVISVGDFCYTDPRPWLDKLNGNKIMLRGNHDNWCEGYAGDWHMILEYKKFRFYLTHDPAYIPKDWKDWAIHGHHHSIYGDKKVETYPFINGKRKNINVACEIIGYKPLKIDTILDLPLNSVKWMNSLNPDLKPEFW